MINKIIVWTVLALTIIVMIYALTTPPSNTFAFEMVYFGSIVYITAKYLETFKD